MPSRSSMATLADDPPGAMQDRLVEQTRLAGYGIWEHVAPGRLDARCFDVPWSVPVATTGPLPYGSSSS